MSELSALENALRGTVEELRARGRRFALVGGLAVSVRAEVRFTRDVDLAVVVLDDADTEGLVFELRSKGYRPLASVEHETQGRLATVRLLAPQGVKVDLLTASSGIEHEVVEGATPVTLEGVGALPVASAEDLLSLKVLSMTDRRLQDRIDADRLVAVNPNLDLGRVRHNLELITARGFHRDQDLLAKLEALIANGARAG
ncbi:MAG: nucleotidyl transferase AbiEii/AbiGii toxin family protein [Polyangiaceae bacterium]|nr:nucleotidyl transferase AbiEii/AbiGii toxin family protein [Polyangiaceae bacterium]